MSVTLKSHLWAHLQLQTSAFLVALEQQLLVDGIIFSVGFIFIWMLIPWICFLQHLQEFLCCYSWIVLLQSVSWWKDKRCLLPLAQRHLPGPLSSVVLLYCGLSTSTTCLQAFVNSSKIIKQSCRGTRCLFFPAQVFADFPWCPLRHRLSRQVWQLRCLMHQILSVSLQWCEKLWKTWLASLSHSSHSCAFLTRIWLKQRQKEEARELFYMMLEVRLLLNTILNLLLLLRLMFEAGGLNYVYASLDLSPQNVLTELWTCPLSGWHWIKQSQAIQVQCESLSVLCKCDIWLNNGQRW